MFTKKSFKVLSEFELSEFKFLILVTIPVFKFYHNLSFVAIDFFFSFVAIKVVTIGVLSLVTI